MNIPAPYLSFILCNSEAQELVLVLEPEAFELTLPPGDEVEVRIGGGKAPLAIKAGRTPDGKTILSLWHHLGSYQVLHQGKDVLNGSAS